MNVQTGVGNVEFRQPQPDGIGRSPTMPDAEAEMGTSLARPDSLPPEVAILAKAMETRMDVIRNAAFSDGLKLPPLSQRQLERISAFALRDQARKAR